ncbi:hypothetical protein N9253_00585 [bacterium]|nr:hypothetical protein [bacterium]
MAFGVDVLGGLLLLSRFAGPILGRWFVTSTMAIAVVYFVVLVLDLTVL